MKLVNIILRSTMPDEGFLLLQLFQ